MLPTTTLELLFPKCWAMLARTGITSKTFHQISLEKKKKNLTQVQNV